MPQKGLVNKAEIISRMSSIYTTVDTINTTKQFITGEYLQNKTDLDNDYNTKVAGLNKRLQSHENTLNELDQQLSILEKRQHKPIILTLS